MRNPIGLFIYSIADHLWLSIKRLRNICSACIMYLSVKFRNFIIRNINITFIYSKTNIKKQ